MNGTKDFGIKYYTSQDFILIGYTDNDFGGNIDDTKSTSSYTFHFGTGIVMGIKETTYCDSFFS